MEFVREIRQVESTRLLINIPESFVSHSVEILVLPYQADQQSSRIEFPQQSPENELEALRTYYRTFNASLTFQTLADRNILTS